MLAGILENARHHMHGTAALLQHVQQTDGVTAAVLLVAQCVQQDQSQGIGRIDARVVDEFFDALQICGISF